jgi:dTDP-4-dehydrorhamnose 3,5-epimerase/reductase
MNSARFLIVGANGQLGTALRERFPDAVAVDRDMLDIANHASVKSFDWSGVDIIINAAAYTNVDGAETPEGRLAAWQINAQAVSYLAQAAITHDLTFVHISSEYVFDGHLTPHTEDEPLTPLGVYAQTKAAGDIVAALAPKHYIVRTSWVIGEGKNFVRTMMGLADKDVSPTVVSDQTGRLTFTATLVEAIEHLLTTSAPYGAYNATNDGEPASWADITRTIFKELGRDDLTVTNTTTEEYFASKPDSAPRPLHSELDLSKIKAAGWTPRDWHDELKDYISRQIKE